jgi:1,5-anhydro-D-fructose reductase (1,5-anhydro-D-mannitol-forming)
MTVTSTSQGTSGPVLVFGLIGASNIASSRMLPAFESAGIRVQGIYDSEERRFATWQDRGLGEVTANLPQLLQSPIDAVYISSRNDQHRDHAIAAAEAGKHILLEKPMALSVIDARDIIAAADKNNVVLAVNHHLPGSPLHVTARRLVREGRIGRLLSARANHAVELPEHLRGWRLSTAPGAGVIMDITVHDASVLNPLFGTEATRVSALAVAQAEWNATAATDAAMTIIEYEGEDGGRARLAQSHDAFTVPYPGTVLEIHGDAGSIRIVDALTQDTPGLVEVTDANGVEIVDVDCSADLYVIILRAFADAVAGRGEPTVTGRAGLRALKVALAAEASVRSGRVVELADL